MNTSNVTIEKVGLKYGLLTCAGLIVYFLAARVLGLAQVTELRTLNLLIMITGIWFGLKYFRKHSESHLTYYEGMVLGAYISMAAVLPFAVFIMFYLLLDTGFMQMIQERESFGEFLNPYILSFIISFEGLISGVLVSFGLMQYLKKSHMTHSGMA